MKNILSYTLLFAFILCNSAKAQTIGNAPTAIVRNIDQGKDGNIWIASFEGMFKYDGKFFTNVTKSVTPARFFSVLEDSKGILWFGSIGSGVYRYDGKNFENFTTSNGLLNNEVTWIYEDKAGYIWFGVDRGATRYDGKSFKSFVIDGEGMIEEKTGKTFPDSRPPHEVTCIIEDKAGNFWFSTRGNTFIYDGKKFTAVSNNGKPFANVRSMIEDKNGNVWLGGNDGLWRYDGKIFTNVTSRFTGFILEDKDGNIWTASGSVNGRNDWNLSRYNVSSLSEVFIVPDKIKEDGGVFGIMQAKDGNIWFGTTNGVYKYDGKDVKDFRVGLPKKTP